MPISRFFIFSTTSLMCDLCEVISHSLKNFSKELCVQKTFKADNAVSQRCISCFRKACGGRRMIFIHQFPVLLDRGQGRIFIARHNL